MIQNFSKFLIKDGKAKWFPARSTKVVSVRAVTAEEQELTPSQSDVEAAL